MKEPKIKKFPTEIFCYPYTEHSDKAKNALNWFFNEKVN